MLNALVRRDGRINRVTFYAATIGSAFFFFVVLWLGCSVLMLLSGGHPSMLLEPGHRWPMLPALWYGGCSVGFVAGSANLFFNRLNDTRLPEICSAAIWAFIALGLFSSAAMTLALVTATDHPPFYFAAAWGILHFVLSLPAPRDELADNSHWTASKTTDADTADSRTGWMEAAEADIAWLASEPAPKPVLSPPAGGPTFGKRKSAPGP